MATTWSRSAGPHIAQCAPNEKPSAAIFASGPSGSEAVDRRQDDPVDRLLVGGPRQALGALDRRRDLAAEHVRRDDREPGFGEPVRVGDDVVVQAPPRVEHDDPGRAVAASYRRLAVPPDSMVVNAPMFVLPG